MKNLSDDPNSEVCRRNEDRSITVFRHEPSDLEAVARIMFSLHDQNALLRNQLESLSEEAILLEYIFHKGLLDRDKVLEMMDEDVDV